MATTSPEFESPEKETESHRVEDVTKETVLVAGDADEEFKFTLGKFVAILVSDIIKIPRALDLPTDERKSFQLGYLSDTFVLVMASATLRVINADLGPSNNYVWIATSQSVGTAALAPIIGRFSDIFGRRNFLIAGNLIAMVGTVVSATARNINAVIVGGVLIGIASSMRQLAWAALGELVPKRSRGVAFGFLQAAISPASAFGPLIAFAFINNTGSWRPIYWLCFSLDTTSLLLVFLCYRPVSQYIREEGKSVWGQVKEIDYVGTFLFIAGIVLFLLGISWGGSSYPWASAGTIVPIILGLVVCFACGIYETYAKTKYPIFPPSLFQNVRGFTVVVVGVFAYGMLFYATAVLWPEQIQTLYTQNQIVAGLYSMAPGIGGMCAPVPGYLLRRFAKARWQFTGNMLILTILSGVQAIVSPSSYVPSTIIAFFVYVSVSAASVHSTSILQVGVKHEFLGIASGILVVARSLGGAVATTIYLAILQNKVTSKIPTDVAAPLAKGGVPLAIIPDVITALTSGQLNDPSLSTVSPAALLAAGLGLKEAYSSGFRLVYLISIAFGLVATMTVAFTANVDHLFSNTVEMTLEEGVHLHGHMDTNGGHIIGKNMTLDEDARVEA